MKVTKVQILSSFDDFVVLSLMFLPSKQLLQNNLIQDRYFKIFLNFDDRNAYGIQLIGEKEHLDVLYNRALELTSAPTKDAVSNILKNSGSAEAQPEAPRQAMPVE